MKILKLFLLYFCLVSPLVAESARIDLVIPNKCVVTPGEYLSVRSILEDLEKEETILLMLRCFASMDDCRFSTVSLLRYPDSYALNDIYTPSDYKPNINVTSSEAVVKFDMKSLGGYEFKLSSDGHIEFINLPDYPEDSTRNYKGRCSIQAHEG